MIDPELGKGEGGNELKGKESESGFNPRRGSDERSQRKDQQSSPAKKEIAECNGKFAQEKTGAGK